MPQPTATAFNKTLSFEAYTFNISTTDTGAIRKVVLVVSREGETLVTIRPKIDGYITNAEVADLDKNSSPELYFYSTTYGTGSFGKVYGFQFYANTFDVIKTDPLTKSQAKGYMGHDRFAIEDGFLSRRFPIFNMGDINAKPTGGTALIRYQLVAGSNQKLVLKSYF